MTLQDDNLLSLIQNLLRDEGSAFNAITHTSDPGSSGTVTSELGIGNKNNMSSSGSNSSAMNEVGRSRCIIGGGSASSSENPSSAAISSILSQSGVINLDLNTNISPLFTHHEHQQKHQQQQHSYFNANHQDNSNAKISMGHSSAVHSPIFDLNLRPTTSSGASVAGSGSGPTSGTVFGKLDIIGSSLSSSPFSPSSGSGSGSSSTFGSLQPSTALSAFSDYITPKLGPIGSGPSAGASSNSEGSNGSNSSSSGIIGNFGNSNNGRTHSSSAHYHPLISTFQEQGFESALHEIANEISSTIQMHMSGLNLRREQLLQQLEHIKKTYLAAFKRYRPTVQHDRPLRDEDEARLVLPNVSFTKPDPALYKAVSSLGFLTTPAFAQFCSASGDGLEAAVSGVNTCFTINTRNCFNEELLIGRETVNVDIAAIAEEGGKTERTTIPHSLLDHNNGKYSVSYMLPLSRSYPVPKFIEIRVQVNGMPMASEPYIVPIRREQPQHWSKVMTYGSEGSGLGQLCRPWGVDIAPMPAMDMEGENSPFPVHLPSGKDPSAKAYLIAVADRSNNRVQLLKFESSILLTGLGSPPSIAVLQVFGSGPGTRPGQFDRPAGISLNISLAHVLVADKDNHRIQVFDLSGRYLFKFGEKGNRVGQFCYPWDIASCPTSHQILVSDTRNRRVQLFTSYGQYITHFAQPLDSPRGLSFLGDKKVAVSDFNKHRILLFDKFGGKDDASGSRDGGGMTGSGSGTNLSNSASNPKFLGFGEGSSWGEFLRPQGVAVSGNIIFCSDSRNNRIAIYNTLTQVFEYLTEELDLDRPAGLAVMDNVLVVVDFGHNRLQICQR